MNVIGMKEKFGGAPHSKQSLRLWLSLFSCTTVIEKRLRNKLIDELDTTLPRFDVLAALERAPNGLTMGELSNALMVSNGNVTGLVNRLITDGYVSRQIDAKDHRTFRVQLSDLGRKEFNTMAKVHEDWVDTMFADLIPKEIEDLMGLLHRVRTSIAKSEQEPANV